MKLFKLGVEFMQTTEVYWILLVGILFILAYTYDTWINIKRAIKKNGRSLKFFHFYYIFITLKTVTLGCVTLFSALYVFAGFFR